MDEKAKKIEEIAKRVLGVETINERMIDSLDFYDIHITKIEEALELAYQAGKESK